MLTPFWTSEQFGVSTAHRSTVLDANLGINLRARPFTKIRMKSVGIVASHWPIRNGKVFEFVVGFKNL